MPERIDKLKSTLQELEAELASIDSLDEETRAVLESTLEEITQRLRKRSSDPQPESLAERLQDAASEFETSHPTLFGIVTRIVDALGQIGI